MISTILAQQRLKHIAQRIEEREINIDAEYCMYLAKPLKADTAFILNENKPVWYLDNWNFIVLVVRMFETKDLGNIPMPVTIEYRRTSQTITNSSLGVLNIQKLNLEV